MYPDGVNMGFCCRIAVGIICWIFVVGAVYGILLIKAELLFAVCLGCRSTLVGICHCTKDCGGCFIAWLCPLLFRAATQIREMTLYVVMRCNWPRHLGLVVVHWI